MQIKAFQIHPIIITAVSLFLLIVVTKPLFSETLLGTADGFAHKYRLVNFHAAINEGIFRPRWIGNAALGFGAPLYIFNYSVPYYVVDAIYRLGFSIQTASQLYSAITFIASFISMYLLASLYWTKLSGLVAASVYTFAPYHLITVYSYEGWGEMLAFVFPPFLLWLLLYMFRHWETDSFRKILFFCITTFTWILFILTHNISSFITTPLIVLVAWLQAKDNSHQRKYISLVIISAILISSFFTIPAITLTHTIKISDLLTKEIALRSMYMIPVLTQITVSWSAVTQTFQILYKEFTAGIPIIGSLLYGLVFCVLSMFKKQNRTNIFFLALLVAAIGALFLVDPLSNFLYVFKPIQYVLYPYRFLFVVTFAGSLVAGYLARKNFLFSVLIITSSVIFGLPFTKPYIEIFPFPQTFFDQPQMLGYAIPTKKTMGTAEFLPKSADITFLVNEEKKYMESGVLPQPVIIPAADGTVTSVTKKQQSLMTNVSIKNPTSITISTFFYPGWHATINAKPLTIYADSVGRITAPIPPGNHKIAFSFGRSPVENVGIIISILGIVFFLGSIKKIQTRSIQS